MSGVIPLLPQYVYMAWVGTDVLFTQQEFVPLRKYFCIVRFYFPSYPTAVTSFCTGVLISPQPDREGNKLQRQKILIFIYPIFNHGAWGSVVVKALRYQSDGPGIDPRRCHLGFFPWFLPTKPCAMRSTQPLKMSTRDFSWGKGGRCVRLTTYHPCSAQRRVDPGP